MREPAWDLGDDRLVAWSVPFELPSGDGEEIVALVDVPEAGVTILGTPAGTMLAVPSDGGEVVAATVAFNLLRFDRGWRPGTALPAGTFVYEVPGMGVLLEALALGTGALTFTDERVVGVVWDSHVDAEAIDAGIDLAAGTGLLRVVSAPREYFQLHSFHDSRPRSIRAVTMTGAAWVSGEPIGLVEPETGEVLRERPEAIRWLVEAFLDDDPLPLWEDVSTVDYPEALDDAPVEGDPEEGNEGSPSEPSRWFRRRGRGA